MRSFLMMSVTRPRHLLMRASDFGRQARALIFIIGERTRKF